MPLTQKTLFIWKCDGCNCTINANSNSLPRPRTGRSWAVIQWRQDDAFDYSGCPWANRVSGDGTITLCDDCADRVYAAIHAPGKGA